MDMIMPYAKQFGANPLQQYGGPTVAGFTPFQTQAQEGAVGTSAPAGTALGTAAAGAQSNILSPQTLDIANNPQFQGMAGSITDLANRNLMQNILPAVSGQSTVAGGTYAGGGTRGELAQGKAIGDTAIGTNSAISQLASQMYGQGLNAQGQAIANNPSVQAQQLFGPEVMSSVGGQQQSLQQQQMNDAATRFYTGQMLPFMQSSDLMSLLTGMPSSTTSTSTGSVPSPSPFSMLTGGAAALGGLAPFLKLFGMGGGGGLGGAAAGLLMP